MANTWLRLYHDMPNDPKWRTIARSAKQTIPVVLAVYVHLLTIASGALDRGTLTNVNSEDLASALDIDSEAVDAVLVAMQGRVLEGEKLSGWDKRQYEREDGAAERARAWREKKKTERNRTQPNATNGSRTQTNVSERKRTPDTEKSREEEISTKTLASTADAVPAKGKLLGTLPLNDGTDYEVREFDVGELARLYPAVDVPQEFRNMKGWLLANPTNRKTRTGVARFINSWLSKEQNKAPIGVRNGTFKGKTESSIDAAAEAVAIIRARGQAGRDRIAADEAGSETTGEAGDSGLLSFRGGSGQLLTAGHRISDGVTVLAPPR